ncbi:MAG: MAPEG family protein [Proteobacteria bacterium]|nr:MAPEG family protein [Pseudomonadota bacterium]
MDDVTPAAGALPDFNIFGWPWTGLVTILTLVLYQYFAVRVGHARKKYQIDPPTMTGNPDFERRVRIHLNTLEQLIIFLPLLWIAALSTRDDIAAAIGTLWPISRIWYAIDYTKDPKTRHKGFLMGVLVLLALLALCLVQLVRSVFVWQ